MMPGPGKDLEILIVDDDSFIRESIELFLESEGFQVRTASDGEKGVELFRQQEPDVALVDLRMPRMNGIEVLREFKKQAPEVEVVMATGAATLESALSAMKLGAYSYIEKPIVDLQKDLLEVLLRAAERRKLRKTNRDLQGQLQLIQHQLEKKEREQRTSICQFPIEQLMRNCASAHENQLRDLILATMPIDGPAILYIRKDQHLIPCSARQSDLPAEHFSMPISQFSDSSERWREGNFSGIFADQGGALVLPLFWIGQLEGLIAIPADHSRFSKKSSFSDLRCAADASAAILGALQRHSSSTTG
ncbi:MAG: response regulator [Planctomycetota bacterium]